MASNDGGITRSSSSRVRASLGLLALGHVLLSHFSPRRGDPCGCLSPSSPIAYCCTVGPVRKPPLPIRCPRGCGDPSPSPPPVQRRLRAFAQPIHPSHCSDSPLHSFHPVGAGLKPAPVPPSPVRAVREPPFPLHCPRGCGDPSPSPPPVQRRLRAFAQPIHPSHCSDSPLHSFHPIGAGFRPAPIPPSLQLTSPGPPFPFPP